MRLMKLKTTIKRCYNVVGLRCLKNLPSNHQTIDLQTKIRTRWHAPPLSPPLLCWPLCRQGCWQDPRLLSAKHIATRHVFTMRECPQPKPELWAKFPRRRPTVPRTAASRTPPQSTKPAKITPSKSRTVLARPWLELQAAPSMARTAKVQARPTKEKWQRRT